MTRDALYPIQYLRAAAALAVFFFHLSVTLKGPTRSHDVPIEQVGAAGVDLFFVVSGFIMAMIVWDKPTTFLGFMRDRIVRIAPLYWLATLAVFAIAVFAPTLLGSTKADPVQLLHSLLFIPYGLGAESSAPTLLIGWTLNYEMFFYCLIGIFAGLANDRSLIATSVFICCLAGVGIFFQPGNGYAKFYLDPIIVEFPMGILVFHCWRLTSGATNKFLSGVFFWVALAAIVLLFDRDAGQLRFIYWGIPAALLLFGGLHFITFKNEPLKWVGDWSYSIYLLHLFVIMGFLKLVGPMLLPLTIPRPLLVTLVTAALIAVSAISFYWFELPVTRWLKARPFFAGSKATRATLSKAADPSG